MDPREGSEPRGWDLNPDFEIKGIATSDLQEGGTVPMCGTGATLHAGVGRDHLVASRLTLGAVR